MSKPRCIVIPDIHGAAKCLEQVLERAGKADRYIFLGDYVDGYPETPRVIEILSKLQHEAECIFIRGNHDQWAMDWIGGMYNESKGRELRGEPLEPDAYKKKPVKHHYDQGGKATYDAYMALPDERRVLRLGFDAGWMSNTVEHFVDEHNRLFVHGGLDSAGLDGTIHVKMWDCDLMEYAWRKATNKMHTQVPVIAQMQEEHLGPLLNSFKEIYVGHTATKFFTDKEEPANWLNLWAMDTNCGWGGPLCAMDCGTKECYYSDPARELYPNHQGR